jgi:hypothetical protein
MGRVVTVNFANSVRTLIQEVPNPESDGLFVRQRRTIIQLEVADHHVQFGLHLIREQEKGILENTIGLVEPQVVVLNDSPTDRLVVLQNGPVIGTDLQLILHLDLVQSLRILAHQ